MLKFFADSDFYDLTVEHDSDTGKNFLRCIVNFGSEAEEYAVIIGDALHNLRSALDLAYYKIVILCDGTPSKWTTFPIRDTREELVARVKSAFEKKQIIGFIHFLLIEVIKPYKGGNDALWTLNEWNIADKHQLLIPVLKLMVLRDVRFTGDSNMPIERQFMFTDSLLAYIKGTDGLNLTVQNKGKASANIFLADDVVDKIESVIPALRRIAEEVTKTIEAFESAAKIAARFGL